MWLRINIGWLREHISFDQLSSLALVAFIAAVGFAIALLPLTLAGIAILGGIVLLATLIRPEFGLYILIFAIPFGSIKEMTIGGFTVGAAEASAGLVLACWLAKMAAVREVKTAHPPLLLPFLIFLGAILLSLTGALSLRYSLKEVLKWLEALAIYLFVVNITSRERAEIAVTFILLAGIGQALLGLYQFLGCVGPKHFVILGRFVRAYGTFEQPNPYGGYLGLVLPLTYGMLLGAGKSDTSHRSADLLLAVLGFVLMGSALIMSWSRGAWLGFIAAFVAMNMAYSRRWAVIFTLACLFVASLPFLSDLHLLPEAIAHRLVGLLPYLSIFDVRGVEVTSANYAIVERMAHWQAAWGMFSDHPWLGVGIGNYEPVYPAYALPGWEEPLGHAHNYYLNIMAETGLVGLTAYLLLWGAAFLRAWKAVRTCNGYRQAVAVGIFGALVHLSVHNLFDNLYVHSMQVHIAILLGLLWAIGADDREEDAHRH